MRRSIFILLGLILSSESLAGTTPTSVGLAWTAPGDDGSIGRAAQYDLRYSQAPITPGNFSFATRWMATPAPGIAGMTDSVTVTGLIPATTYYFAIETADEVPNWSALSNVLAVTTLPPPDVTPPDAIIDLRPK